MWVLLTLSSLSPLFHAELSLNFGNIKRKILWNVENQTRGCWVRSKCSATSVLCSPLVRVSLHGLPFNARWQHWSRLKLVHSIDTLSREIKYYSLVSMIQVMRPLRMTCSAVEYIFEACPAETALAGVCRCASGCSESRIET